MRLSRHKWAGLVFDTLDSMSDENRFDTLNYNADFTSRHQQKSHVRDNRADPTALQHP